jgi:hypothetical protein
MDKDACNLSNSWSLLCLLPVPVKALHLSIHLCTHIVTGQGVTAGTLMQADCNVSGLAGPINNKVLTALSRQKPPGLARIAIALVRLDVHDSHNIVELYKALEKGVVRLKAEHLAGLLQAVYESRESDWVQTQQRPLRQAIIHAVKLTEMRYMSASHLKSVIHGLATLGVLQRDSVRSPS